MQHLVVTAVGQCFAIPSSRVVEVIPPVAVAALAGLPDWMPGCIRYRGALVPLVDLGLRLEAERAVARASPAPSGADTPTTSAGGPPRLGNRLIIVEASSGRGERRLGILVDAVLSLTTIDSRPSGTESCDTAGEASAGGSPARPRDRSWLGRIVERERRTIQLLDPGAILPAGIAERIFPASQEADGNPPDGTDDGAVDHGARTD